MKEHILTFLAYLTVTLVVLALLWVVGSIVWTCVETPILFLVFLGLATAFFCCVAAFFWAVMYLEEHHKTKN